jgi:hypothetical protein
VNALRLAVPLAAALAAAGCVTEQVEPDRTAGPLPQAPVVIALPGSTSDAAVAEYYADVLRQLRDALAGGQLEQLEQLLAIHDRQGAPEWAPAPMRAFRRAAAGLRFVAGLRERARIVLHGPPPLGAPLDVALEVAQDAGWPVVLGGPRDALPSSFLVRFTVTDFDAFGDHWTREHGEIVPLPARVALASAPLRLPVRVTIDAGAAVLRELEVEIELLPGQVAVAGQPAPHKRATIAKARWTLYPQNWETVRKDPLATLRTALRLGDPSLHAHVHLACRFLPEQDVEPALQALIRAVRVGDPALARVAGAGLALLTHEPFAPQDREAWLAWWQRR